MTMNGYPHESPSNILTRYVITMNSLSIRILFGRLLVKKPLHENTFLMKIYKLQQSKDPLRPTQLQSNKNCCNYINSGKLGLCMARSIQSFNKVLSILGF